MNMQTITACSGSGTQPSLELFDSTVNEQTITAYSGADTQPSLRLLDSTMNASVSAARPLRTENIVIFGGSQQCPIGSALLAEGNMLYRVISSPISPGEWHKCVFYRITCKTPAEHSTVLCPQREWRPRAAEGLASAIDRAVGSADSLEFEDGFENEFTIRLIGLVRKYRSAAIEKLAGVLFQPEVTSEVATQALLCLGRIEDEGTYLARSWVLQRGLLSASAKVRDAAAIGISSLADVRAMDSLAAAIGKEPIHDLKEDMQAVLSYLQSVK